MQAHRTKRTAPVPESNMQDGPAPRAEAMPNSLMLKNLQGAEHLDPARGTGRQLPDSLKERLNAHFGHDVGNVSFLESQDVSDAGMKAYTSGSVVKFAPGSFQPESPAGQRVIAHELAHVEQQASGRVSPNLHGGLNYDPALESQADLRGNAFQNSTAVHAPLQAETAPLTPMPVMGMESAPVQGWGAGGWMSRLIGKTKIKEGEHEALTRLASEQADSKTGNKPFQSKKAQKDLRFGSRFNDVYNSGSGIGGSIGFGAKYTLHSDEFINQSHHGDMQFLHSMSNKESAKVNKEKSKRWAEFAIDTHRNEHKDGKSFQSQNMLDYTLGSDDTFQDMMLSTMVDKSDMKKIEKETAWLKKRDPKMDERAKRRELMRSRLTDLDPEEEAKYQKYVDKGKGEKAEKYKQKQIDSHRSKYAKGSIAEFFQGGDKKRDAGTVATGSLSHMLEDSVAGSHGQRIFNTKTARRTDKENADIDVSDEAQVLGTLSPVMLHADYGEQDEKRHGLADFLDMEGEGKFSRQTKDADLQKAINRSEGSRQGQLLAGHMMHSLATGKDKKSMLDFVDKALSVDENALLLQEIQQAKEAKDPERIAQLMEKAKDTDLAGLNLADLDIGTTKSGRQYQKGSLYEAEKTHEDAETKKAKTRKHWYSLRKTDSRPKEEQEGNKQLAGASDSYEKMLAGQERGNKAYTSEVKLQQYADQLSALEEANRVAKSDETRVRVRQHMTEILLNVSGMKQDERVKDKAGEMLKRIKDSINGTGKLK